MDAQKLLKPGEGFRDLKLEALNDSSSRGEVWEGCRYAMGQIELLTEAILSLTETAQAARDSKDYTLAEGYISKGDSLLREQRYYCAQQSRLLKVWSRKTGDPTIISKPPGRGGSIVLH